MRVLAQRSAAFRLGFVMAAVGLLTPLAALMGCKKQEEKPTPTGGAIYYPGPRQKNKPPAGGGPAGP